MSYMTLGVIHQYQKEDEKRIAIHPDQFGWIDAALKPNIYFEAGYGERFQVSDAEISAEFGGVRSRAELINACDIILLPKPLASDLWTMRKRQVLWGWPHCVQQPGITEAAIENRLTVIAWEAMNYWTPKGEWKKHVFDKNNEIAGYAGVQDALRLSGKTACYGPQQTAVVIGTGSVSRGAIQALQGNGFAQILVLSTLSDAQIKDQVPGIQYATLQKQDDYLTVRFADYTVKRLIDVLAAQPVIVNAILQNPNQPLMYMTADEQSRLQKQVLIVDVSCDEKMGFPFAVPTSFKHPMRQFGHIHYYAVDHTPSLYWNVASWEISKALIPYLHTVMSGPEAWLQEEVIARAIEIQEGQIRNPEILKFQNRTAEFPHAIQKAPVFA